jgi:outer membrane protein
LTRYKEAIRKQDIFRWNVELNYIHDDNINEASEDKYIKLGDWLLERTKESLPQSGEGIEYGVSIQKDIPLKDYHVLVGSFQTYGKSYWNNHDYDDFVSRVNLGYRFQDGTKSLLFMPFFQKRFFANSPYNYTIGTRLAFSSALTNRLQGSVSVEYGQNNYNQRVFLDGWYLFGSLGYSYFLTPQTLLFGGFDIYDNHTKDASESFLKGGIRGGIVQDLPYAMSIQMVANYGKRNYEDAPNFFGIRRFDKEYGALVTLWNRKWYIGDIMPKLNFEYANVDSTINVYEYSKQRVFMTLDKSF